MRNHLSAVALDAIDRTSHHGLTADLIAGFLTLHAPDGRSKELRALCACFHGFARR